MNKSLTSRIVALVCLGLFTLQSFAGTVTGQVQNAAAGPVRNGTFSFTLTAPATVAGTATVVTSSVPCYTDGNGNVAGEPDPLLAPVLSVNLASGTLPAATYFVKIWYFDGTGNSFVSPEASISLVSIGTLNILSPVKQPLNASGYRIGISTVSGSETIQGSVTGVPGAWGNFSQSVPLTVPAAAAPVSNTTVCTLRFNDELTPSFTCYDVGLTSSTGANIPGFPQYWYLNGGSAGTINVGSGTPQSNVCQGQGVVYPQAIVTLPPFNATQTINGGLNLNGFPLMAGVGTFKTINTIRYADQFVGPDICAQISAAIADLPAQGGTVDARAFNVSSSLVCTSGTVTIGSATKPVKLLLPPTIIINNAAVVAFNLVKGCIVGDGTSGLGSRIQNNTVNADTLQINGARNCVHDLSAVRGVASAGAAVHLIGTGTTGADHNDLTNVRADCSNSSSGSIAFQWTASSATALVSQNVFSQVYTDECDVDFQLDSSGTQGPTDNQVFGYSVTNTSSGTVGIKVVSSTADANQFYGGIIAGKATAISVASGAHFDQFYAPRLETNTANINNAGIGTQFYGLSVDANTITDTGTCTVIMGGAGNVPFTQKKGCNDFGGLVPNSQRFAANGTFTIPAGITAVKVTVIAAGGAGGGGSTTTWGTGGGSGGTGIKYLSGLTPGSTIAVTVGTGGTGVANATGNTGGDSIIASGTQTITTVTAKGGVGGLSVAGQNPGGAGGAAGTNGDINAGGNPGGINSANSFGGNGGSSTLGGGGNGPASHVAGTAGTAPGAGGSGSSETAAGTSAGGSGADGIVIFEWVN